VRGRGGEGRGRGGVEGRRGRGGIGNTNSEHLTIREQHLPPVNHAVEGEDESVVYVVLLPHGQIETEPLRGDSKKGSSGRWS
jgi:hypothetical protein